MPLPVSVEHLSPWDARHHESVRPCPCSCQADLRVLDDVRVASCRWTAPMPDGTWLDGCAHEGCG